MSKNQSSCSCCFLECLHEKKIKNKKQFQCFRYANIQKYYVRINYSHSSLDSKMVALDRRKALVSYEKVKYNLLNLRFYYFHSSCTTLSINCNLDSFFVFSSVTSSSLGQWVHIVWIGRWARYLCKYNEKMLAISATLRFEWCSKVLPSLSLHMNLEAQTLRNSFFGTIAWLFAVEVF